MASIHVTARIYDKLAIPLASNGVEANNTTVDSENGFDKILESSISNRKKNCVCSSKNPDSIDKADKAICGACASENPDSIKKADDAIEETEIQKCASSLHSTYLKITIWTTIGSPDDSTSSSASDSILEQFKAVTRTFAEALLNDDESDVEPLNKYLKHAEQSCAKGKESMQSLVDRMLSSAEGNLKSIVNSMLSNSSMIPDSNFGSPVSVLTSVSTVDIAKVHLQGSIRTINPILETGSGKIESENAVGFGSDHSLDLVPNIYQNPSTIPGTEKNGDIDNKDVVSNFAAVGKESRAKRILEKFIEFLG